MNTKHTARTCASAVVLGSLVAGTPLAFAQPTDFIDLGVRSAPETLVIPLQLRSERDVRWYRVELPGATPAGGFIDLWTVPPLDAAPLGGHHVVVCDSNGAPVAVSENVTEWDQAWLSFGSPDPRPPVTMPYTGVQDPIAAPEFDGRSGVVVPGAYWLAVVRGGGFIGQSDWDIRPPFTHSDQRDTILHLRIQPPDVPYCDGDFNWDGNVDQQDIIDLIDYVGGAPCPL